MDSDIDKEMEPFTPVLIGATTAAKILGVSADTVRRWTREKKLQGVLTENGTYYSRVDIVNIASELTQETLHQMEAGNG